MHRFAGAISQYYNCITQALPGYYDLQYSLASLIAERYVKPVVVDVGLGTGITTKAIVERNPGCTVKGVDNEILMIDQAKSKLAAEIARGAVEIHHGDALTYLRDLLTASVDVVASAYTIHNCSKLWRTQLEGEIFRTLRPGGMFVNNDKYAADDRQEYVSEITNQIIRYDLLKEQGRDELRRLWIEHEIEDQDPERIMWTTESLDQLRSVGFSNTALVKRLGQYAIVVAFKPILRGTPPRQALNSAGRAEM
jgi:tRNA (cmo5U34)-methyltransferase